MKICLFTDAWKPIWGGGQEHIWQTSKILTEKYGYCVDVIAPNLGFSNETCGKLRVIRVGPKFIFPNPLGRAMATIATIPYLFKDYDIFISHSYPTCIFIFFAKFSQKRIAFMLHGEGKDVRGAGILNILGLPTVFKWVIDNLWPIDIKMTAAHKNGWQWVGNGVNHEDFDKVKVSKDKNIVLWVGRADDKIKGLKYAKEAIKIVQNKYPGIKLDIVPGNVFGRDKIKRFKRASIFLMSSLSEGLPLVLLEAMAAKLPVVVTDVGDSKRIVEQARCGLVVKPRDSQGLARAIEKVMDMNGNNGYRYIKNNYQWTDVVDRLLKAINL